MIGRKDLTDLYLSGALLSVLYANHSLSKKVFLIRRPMINFVLISDPRPYVVDTQVKSSYHPGDELNQMADEDTRQTWCTKTYSEVVLRAFGRGSCLVDR